MRKTILASILLCAVSLSLKAQNTSFKTKNLKSYKIKSVSKIKNKKGFKAQIINLEAPSPDGNSYKSFLMQQKIESKKQFPYKNTTLRNATASEIDTPILSKSFGMMQYNTSNELVPIYGGLPNDNSMAVSNNGLMLMAINSYVQVYDLNNDSILYPDESLTLREVFDLPSGNYFDPKVIYDNDMDRFVLVFLKNNNPASTKIIVGFSKTNNPIDGWNVYELPGNPLDNNRWTDFPTIALSDSSLYFSGNLIIPNVSWQVGFDGSILWEMDKFNGYQGDTSIEQKLYYDIKFNDNYIRNMHCIQGADGNVSEFHLLSNRNFDIQNDSIFLVSLKNFDADSSYIEVEAFVSDTKYGAPPNARQSDTDTSDATDGLQTNDARVLGAIQFEDEIQFVSTSLNTENGFASIYHGVVYDLYEEPYIRANIISDEIKDYGYPNIAWTGNEACDREVIIAFNHTSFTDSAGISAIYCDNERNYSDVIEIKKGEGIVDRLTGGYERWGDYFGMQRKYNEPGKVYTFGMTADNTNRNYGWTNELISPDTNTIGFTYQIISEDAYCDEKIAISAYGGIPPYSVEWNNSTTNTSLLSDNYCNGDTSSFTVFDSRECMISDKVYIELNKNAQTFALFPNPTNDLLAFQFTADDAIQVEVIITDAKGSFVEQIIYQEVKKGLNELYFSTEPLPKGIYYVKIISNKTVLSKEKFVKY